MKRDKLIRDKAKNNAFKAVKIIKYNEKRINTLLGVLEKSINMQKIKFKIL